MEYFDQLLFIMRNLVEYKHYQNDPVKALKTFRKYFPEIPEEKCKTDFDNFRHAYEDSIGFVKAHADYFTRYYSGLVHIRSDEENIFRRKHKNVSEKWLSGMIGWVYNWHIER